MGTNYYYIMPESLDTIDISIFIDTSNLEWSIDQV